MKDQDLINNSLDEKQTLAATLVIQSIKNLPTLAEKEGITSDELQSSYQLAVEFYELGYYQEAIKLLKPLAYLSTKTSCYWQALGYCYQQLGNYEKSLDSFLLTLFLGEKGGQLYYAAAYSALALKKFELATYFLSFIDDKDPLFQHSLTLKKLSSYYQSLERINSYES